MNNRRTPDEINNLDQTARKTLGERFYEEAKSFFEEACENSEKNKYVFFANKRSEQLAKILVPSTQQITGKEELLENIDNIVEGLMKDKRMPILYLDCVYVGRELYGLLEKIDEAYKERPISIHVLYKKVGNNLLPRKYWRMLTCKKEITTYELNKYQEKAYELVGKVNSLNDGLPKDLPGLEEQNVKAYFYKLGCETENAALHLTDEVAWTSSDEYRLKLENDRCISIRSFYEDFQYYNQKSYDLKDLESLLKYAKDMGYIAIEKDKIRIEHHAVSIFANKYKEHLHILYEELESYLDGKFDESEFKTIWDYQVAPVLKRIIGHLFNDEEWELLRQEIYDFKHAYQKISYWWKEGD